ncbi:unnamed protein product [Peronospora belbahrii]|uniref:2-oxo-4-hydroxy-4-carboxy-5-ureidoimidazoline decarboxylase n=1 Tax=Peronospora belbahrii TaxID=622444 RepID=A0ABN8CLI0_9STRA|nr:unnamed protein product [Peronospora belbahrii]
MQRTTSFRALSNAVALLWVETVGKSNAHEVVYRVNESCRRRKLRVEDVLDRLEALIVADYNKFGYIYIVCATGKSAPEMICILEFRIDNNPDNELSGAASEESKITTLRLECLVQE